MRAAAILGPGKIAKYAAQFQKISGVEWDSDISDSSLAAVIFGGDGTVHRQLSTLANKKTPTLIVPCGSGNDFARALEMRKISDSLEAWRKYVASGQNVRRIDLGTIRELNPALRQAEEVQVPQEHHFCCVAGVGIDAEIARKANALPGWLRAHGGYATLASREIVEFAPFPMKIQVDGQQDRFRAMILAAVANAPTYGGGMRIAPRAKLDDGLLDVCAVRSMNKFKLFCLFPTVYFGQHLGLKEVEYRQAEIVRVETESPMNVYADGEYVCKTPVEFSVAPAALRVITPG